MFHGSSSSKKRVFMDAFIMVDSSNAPDPNSISIKAWKPDGSTYGNGPK